MRLRSRLTLSGDLEPRSQGPSRLVQELVTNARGLGSLLVLSASLAGCGSTAPVAPAGPPASPLQRVSFSYIKQGDLNAYLQAVDRSLPEFYLVIEEQTVLFDDWSRGRTDPYWTGVYAGNLVLRIRAYSRTLSGIRPTAPDLKQLHVQLQEAINLLESAIADFITAVDTSDPTYIGEANQKIAQFNIAVSRYSLSLGELVGEPVSLFPPQ